MDRKFSKNTYYGYIIKGDLIGAICYIKQFPEQEKLYNRYMAIFEQEQYISYPVPSDLNSILTIYQQYYRDVFFIGIKEKNAAHILREKLAAFLNLADHEIELSDMEQNHIAEVFRCKGFSFMGGKTSGHYGPYLWQSEEIKSYEVELPEGSQRYSIKFLDGFLTKSWIDYLSFGEISPGGWAGADGCINCIKSCYDPDSENFKVSLLKHEAQHAKDLSNYKEMSSEDLEYRAKLVELIYTKERNLLKQFAEEADSSDKNNGHALASNRIIEGFRKQLNIDHAALAELPIAQIQTAARILFEENSKALLNATL